jgi:RNA binding exosome subunit
MKRYLLLFLSVALLSTGCGSLSGLPGYPGTYTESEAAEGIRQALSQGTTSAILNLNKQDGFFGNQAYKLFLPPDASKIEYTLRDLGLGNIVDRAILQINRSAETAVGEAKPIFVDAIKQMTIADAINIVKGQRDAATQYFKDKTTDKLIVAFSPIIKQALDRTNATRYYGDAVNAYNKLPTTFNKINPDLPSYVTQKAVAALFDQIAQEEANIRANPSARGTEILKKVFGKS